jgi:carbonic anhydrase/acetyltransferase-like protein (isoleucine patch superfamily)
MLAFVLDERRTLEFVGDRVADAPIGNRPLRDHQADALGPEAPLRVANLAEIPADARDFLLVRDHVFLTRRIARRFQKAAQRSDAPVTVLGLGPSVFTSFSTALTDVDGDQTRTLYGVYHCRGPGPPAPKQLQSATPVVLSIREHRVPMALFDQRGVYTDGLPPMALSAEAVLHICHWSHLIDANYVAAFCLWFDLSPGKVLRYLGAVVRALWPSRHRLLRALTVRGRRCRIHPTATVEASILGDDVEVGAYSVVFGSVLGDHVRIGSHASVALSALGERAAVSFHAACHLCVLYPQALLSQAGAQFALIGRQATVLTGATMLDLRDPYLERSVLVSQGGRIVDSGRKVLGPCVGHQAVIGANVTLAPGLAVPNGACLLGDPGQVVRRIEGELTPRLAHAVTGDGTIAPVARGAEARDEKKPPE